MGVAERRARHRTSLRRDILDAASRLFVEAGYDRVTMRLVAERIEYSPTTIYLYFKDKAELFDAVCEESFSQLAAGLEQLRTAGLTPVGCLRAELKLYVDFGVAHPDHYAVTLLRGPRSSPAVEAPVGGRAFDLLHEAVRACVESGDIRTPDSDVTARALWASVHGLTAFFVASRGISLVAQAALVDHTIDVLIAGLAMPAAPVRPRFPPTSRVSTFTD